MFGKAHGTSAKKREVKGEVRKGSQVDFRHLKEQESDYNVFCCGSLGREDFGKTSDLDIFVFSEKPEAERTRLGDIELLSKLISVNKELQFPEFSNDGMFLEVLSFSEMSKSIGRPKDDEKNLFTGRMLMLLESKYLSNEKLYDSQIEEIVNLYFRDDVGRSSFRPFFLLNDILRFWRTLCLNYEIIRNDTSKPFRKKNINLKFSRMLTIFATVLPIISQQQCNKEYVLSLCKQSPLNRLAHGLDELNKRGNGELLGEFDKFLDLYEGFLGKKENMSDAPDMDEKEKNKINEMAVTFSEFLYKCLSHSNIREDYRRYLVL